MLPSRPLYGSDKKPSSSDNPPIDNSLPPPPPYSEYNNSPSNSSGYSAGYHERTPTAPPASLLTAANENPPFHYSMPNPPHTNPAYPNYGTVENPSSRYVPDADDYTNYNHNNNNNNNSNDTPQRLQQPLLPPSSHPPSHQKSYRAMISNCYKNNRYVHYLKNRPCSLKKMVCLLCFIGIFVWIIVTGNMDHDHGKNKTPPLHSPPTATPYRVIMNSPYPLSPSHYEYANNDTKEMTDLPISTLTTLAIDFTSHTGELHLVPTEDPVSWISFSTSSGQLDPILISDFTLQNATSLQVVIQKEASSSSYYGNLLTAVLHISRHDRQHARLILKVDTMLVYAISEDPDDMIQDLDVTLKGPRLGLTLPEKGGWKGKNMRIKLEGNNGSFSVCRLEASGTISLELTGLAGGDLALQESIVAKHIKLSSKNGSIVMMGPGASMTADTIDLTTTNSKLLVGSIQARRSCTLRTSNGSIDVTLENTQEDDLDRLDVESENSSIHITAFPLIKRTSIISNLGSITMHTTQNFDGWFDIQSSLSKTTVEDNETGKLKLDVAGKTIKQGRRGRGTRDHQIKLFSYAGSSRLVFDK